MQSFAGATRTDNVVPRKSIIGGISSNPAERYTAERTLNAKYGTWDFIIIPSLYNRTCTIRDMICLTKFMILLEK